MRGVGKTLILVGYSTLGRRQRAHGLGPCNFSWAKQHAFKFELRAMRIAKTQQPKPKEINEHH